ncbi:hypothetical protein F5B20DRAFT_585191 [Whalleya microplaca]|nr:hypothetical protein F5B20DRAFT_585191 [Whalleya microplaca]
MAASGPNAMDAKASSMDVTKSADHSHPRLKEEAPSTSSQSGITVAPLPETVDVIERTLEKLYGHKLFLPMQQGEYSFQMRKIKKAEERTLFEIFAQGFEPPLPLAYYRWHVALNIWCDHRTSRGSHDLLDFPFLSERPSPYERRGPEYKPYLPYWCQNLFHGFKPSKSYLPEGSSQSSALQSQVAKLQENICSLKHQASQEREAEKKRQDQRDKDMNLLKTKNADLEKQIRKLKNQKFELELDVDELETEKRDLVQEREDLFKANKTLGKENKKLQSDHCKFAISQTKLKIMMLEKMSTERRGQMERQERAVTNKKRKHGEFMKSVADVQGDFEQLLKWLQTRFDNLQKDMDN